MPNNAPTDISLTKFDWTRLLGSKDPEEAYAVTTGADGSIYIAGRTYGDLDGQSNNGDVLLHWSERGTDAFISKFNPDGTKEWTKLVGTKQDDEGYALTTGADGSIYIAGSTGGDLDGQTKSGDYYDVDAFISKFNPDGTKEWTRLLGSNKGDSARSLTTGSDGSIYIAGSTGGDLDGQTKSGDYYGNDAFISKFNPDGTKEWTRLLGSNKGAYARSLTTGADGSIYIAGGTTGDLDGQTYSAGYFDSSVPSTIPSPEKIPTGDAFISKFSPDGTKKWTRLLGTSDNELGEALTTGSDGSIYIAGTTGGDLDGQINNGNRDAFISKFNPDGTKDWTRLLGTGPRPNAVGFERSLAGQEEGNALTTGTDGSIYIAGHTSSDLDGQTLSGNSDVFISKFNPDGTKDWTRLLGSFYVNQGKDLTTGTDGSIYIAGMTLGDLDGQTLSGVPDMDIDAFISKLIDLDESVVTISGTDSNDAINGTTDNDNIKGGGGSDVIDGGNGSDTSVYSGEFSNYSFTRATDTLEIADQRSGINDGTDTLSNIEYIQFADQIVESSKVDVVKTYSGEFSDYKFYNKGNGIYQIKTDSGYDDITGLPLLTFTGESTASSFHDVSAIVHIKGTFDQVTGLNTDDAKMFRLYNASFKRLPDPDGLNYWISKYNHNSLSCKH